MQIFTPMSIDRLGVYLAKAGDPDHRWLLHLEFVEEYEHEPATARPTLLQADPPGTGDDRWDALLAGVAEWCKPRWLRRPQLGPFPGRTLPAAWLRESSPTTTGGHRAVQGPRGGRGRPMRCSAS